MNKIKLKKETIDTVKFISILLIIFLVISLLFNYVPPLNKFDVFAIKTDSMEPVISPGDIVVTKQISPEDINPGDIVAFRVDITNDGVDDVVVHYIDGISDFEGKLIFKTKPHVSDIQDRWTIEEEDIIGIYKYQVNGMGKILLFTQSWIGRIIIIIDVIVISIVYDVLFGKKKKNPKEDSNDTVISEDGEEVDDDEIKNKI
jgi:signal peptidase